MEEETAFENGRISNCKGLEILTLDWVILNTIVINSSTSIYTPNFIEIKQMFVDIRTYVCRHVLTDGRMDI